MGYHPRIESSTVASFQTTRTQESRLWFINNRELEETILGYAAKYVARYSVKLYALAIEGNHLQFPASFPKANRAHFMRDFNSSIARALPRLQPLHPKTRVWERRYSAEYLPGVEDIEEQFFYTVLQAVQDGLVDSIDEYDGYNCFEDAIHGRSREFKVVHWKEFNDAQRWNQNVSITDFIESVALRYERLPGYEHLSTDEYVALMRRKLKARTKAVLEKRKGKRSLGRERLKKIAAGSKPRNTKTSHRNSHRPRVLSKDARRRENGKAWYFSIHFTYRECSARYRAGEDGVEFPPGTYKPPKFTVANTEIIPC